MAAPPIFLFSRGVASPASAENRQQGRRPTRFSQVQMCWPCQCIAVALQWRKLAKKVADSTAKYPSQKLMSNSNEIYQLKYKLKEMKSKNKIKISIANKRNFVTLS